MRFGQPRAYSINTNFRYCGNIIVGHTKSMKIKCHSLSAFFSAFFSTFFSAFFSTFFSAFFSAFFSTFFSAFFSAFFFTFFSTFFYAFFSASGFCFRCSLISHDFHDFTHYASPYSTVLRLQNITYWLLYR